jgi:putative membrane protein
LGVGLGAVWGRARALRGTLDTAGLRRVFALDGLWGLAFLLWLVTGLWRVLGGVEKDTSYYLQQPMFHAKMGLLLIVLILELSPMITLIRWRGAARRGETVNTTRALTLARISSLQTLLVILMVFAASAMARGVGF